MLGFNQWLVNQDKPHVMIGFPNHTIALAIALFIGPAGMPQETMNSDVPENSGGEPTQPPGSGSLAQCVTSLTD